MLSVDVLAGDWPFAVPIRMMALGLGALVGGMVVGFFAAQIASRGIAYR
jgi:hypothetical protein